jgi:hypothetical protein
MFDFEPAKVGKSPEPENPDPEIPSLSRCFRLPASGCTFRLVITTQISVEIGLNLLFGIKMLAGLQETGNR